MTLYEKRMRGKRATYEPVAEHVVWDSLPAGHHLVSIAPGSRAVVHNINPDRAAVLAALRDGREALVRALLEASAARPASRQLTPREQQALAAYYAIAGDGARFQLTIPAAATAVDEFEAALVASI